MRLKPWKIIVLIILVIFILSNENILNKSSKNEESNIEYTVTFINENNVFLQENIKDGKSVKQPTIPLKNGYKFKYWSISQDGAEYNFNDPIKSNLTLYACYDFNSEVTIVHSGPTAMANSNKNQSSSTTSTPQSTPSTPSTSSNNSNISMSKSNALKSATSYLRHSHFSYEGLFDQLKFEKYDDDSARYAVDNCGANWNEQALKSAKSYLSSSAFSYRGLIKQLEFEKFTTEQATYGVDNCGANWNEQEKKCAQSYLRSSSFSREKLISQLEFEGFSHEQAEYGVSAIGY